MHEAIRSYRKTVVISALAAAATMSAAYVGQRFASGPAAPLAFLLAWLGWMSGFTLLLITLSGVLASVRLARRERGELDMFLALNASRSESALRHPSSRSRAARFGWLRRWLGAPAYVVGDTVRIRSLDEIGATLDVDGCLDGLPFMPEMARYCGTVGTVFRCVDKIYDYGGRKDMRRLKDTVSIAGLRCDGSAHDGCQAGCYLLWKTAWLAGHGHSDDLGTRGYAKEAAASVSVGGGSRALARTRVERTAGLTYLCQFTQLVRATTQMSPWDPRQDLRPLISGNVTAAAFGLALLTRLFNAIQEIRGGVRYPPTRVGTSAHLARADLGLSPGEVVRVREAEAIFQTLDRTGRNRGLWFDAGMLQHTGRCYRVLRRIDRIIDDASGRMIHMKTPCVILDGVDASGEQVRFLPQHDYPFWREVWLERARGVGGSQ